MKHTGSGLADLKAIATMAKLYVDKEYGVGKKMMLESAIKR